MTAKLAWLTQYPDGLTEDYGRLYVMCRLGFPVGLAIHLVFLATFAHLGLTVLTILNVFSVAAYAIAIELNRRLHFKTASYLVASEVTLHTTLVLIYLGPDTGFQFYLLINAMVILLSPFIRRPVRIALSTLPVVLLLVLIVWTTRQPALTPIPEGWELGFLIGNILGLALVICGVVATYEQGVAKAEAALQREFARSEALLQNILPAEIAAQLKDDQSTIAEAFDEATVLFADIVNFTTIASRMSPGSLIQMLNGVFSEFDELVDRYGLEKIKTIGDAYMVVAGLPAPRQDHAVAMARLALEMVAVAGRHCDDTGTPLRLRVGLSSGPVVAGVIGSKKFAYDLWGDTVNTASRMETLSQPGRVLVSAATKDLVAGDFACEPRPPMEVKGKGLMSTWFLAQGA